MNNNQMIIAAVVVLLLILGGVFFYKSQQKSNQPATDQSLTTQAPADTPVATSDTGSSPTPSIAGSGSITQGEVKEFTVTGSNFNFTPATLTVNKGDTVKITFNNSGGMHDFVIDDFNVKTKTIQSGATDTMTFTADKTGTFEYYCSVGNHRAMGMKGTLTVL